MMKIFTRVFLTCAFFLTLWVTPGFSQQSSSDELEALKRDIEELKKGQSAIQKALQDIQALLQGKRPAPAFQEFVLDIKDEPFKGEIEAQLVLVDFTDYQ